eukprot:TRINITY_DN22339_c1_g2_i4.p10 TRINITY_DN22339_c1_g2~~TRINITY_DN22339_c1_g2_i4.p10  ORF type:complete len:103 (-),score=0.06 TRINITY_DN22339_c1_g2_i4:18-326(-)
MYYLQTFREYNQQTYSEYGILIYCEQHSLFVISSLVLDITEEFNQPYLVSTSFQNNRQQFVSMQFVTDLGNCQYKKKKKKKKNLKTSVRVRPEPPRSVEHTS